MINILRKKQNSKRGELLTDHNPIPKLSWHCVCVKMGTDMIQERAAACILGQVLKSRNMYELPLQMPLQRFLGTGHAMTKLQQEVGGCWKLTLLIVSDIL